MTRPKTALKTPPYSLDGPPPPKTAAAQMPPRPNTSSVDPYYDFASASRKYHATPRNVAWT